MLRSVWAIECGPRGCCYGFIYKEVRGLLELLKSRAAIYARCILGSDPTDMGLLFLSTATRKFSETDLEYLKFEIKEGQIIQ